MDVLMRSTISSSFKIFGKGVRHSPIDFELFLQVAIHSPDVNIGAL